VSLGLDLQRQNKNGRWQASASKYHAAVRCSTTAVYSVSPSAFSRGWPIQARCWLEVPRLARDFGALLVLACPEQLNNAKLSNGPRNRLNLSGAVLPLDSGLDASSRNENSRSLHSRDHRFAMISSGRDDRIRDRAKPRHAAGLRVMG